MSQPIKSNRDLNKKPLVLGIIRPELIEQLLAILVIAGIAGFVLKVPAKYCIAGGLIGTGTWVIYAGKDPYKQLSKFKNKPQYITARIRYIAREDIKER